MTLKHLREAIISFSSRHPVIVILFTICMTALFALYALRIDINADYASLLPEDTKVNRQIREYGGQKPESDLLVLAIKGDNLYTEDILSAFADSIEHIKELPEVQSVISPFNFLAFTKSPTGRLEIQKTLEVTDSAFSPEDVEEFKQRLFTSHFAENLVVSEDHTMLVAFFFTEKRDEYTHLLSEVDRYIESLFFPGVTVHTSGLVVLNERTRFYISRDVVLLISLAVLIIIVFYFFIFRMGKIVFLPILVVLFGTVWSLGFMSLMNYSLTLISIVAPPLILIFGNEYAIYVMSEYYRIIENVKDRPGTPRANIIRDTVGNVTKPIILAFITTVIGFLSLYVTDIKQTQEFAITAGFGSFACGFIALLFLPAVLSLVRIQQDKTTGVKGYARRVGKLTTLASNHPRVVLLIIPIIVICFALSLQHLRFNTDSINYFPKNDPAIKDMYTLTEKIGGFDELNVTFLAPEGEEGYFLQPDILEKILAVEHDLKNNPDVCYTISFPSYIEEISDVLGRSDDEGFSRGLIRLLSRLLKAASADESMNRTLGGLFNEDFTRLTLSMRIYNSSTGHFIDEFRFREFLAFLKDTLHEHGFAEEDRVIWGEVMRNLQLADSLRGYLLISMIISLGLILSITTVTFRSIMHGIYAVLPLAMGLMFNFTLMALFRIPLDMTTIMVSNVTIGVGIDNAFYLVVQYRRSGEKGNRTFAEVIGETMEVILRPTVLSTLSIALGLVVFLLAAFKPIVYFGMLVIFSLSATAVCTLIIIPAILYFDYRKRLS